MISIKSCTESPIFVVIHGPVNHPLPTIGALSVHNKWVRYAVITEKVATEMVATGHINAAQYPCCTILVHSAGGHKDWKSSV